MKSGLMVLSTGLRKNKEPREGTLSWRDDPLILAQIPKTDNFLSRMGTKRLRVLHNGR